MTASGTIRLPSADRTSDDVEPRAATSQSRAAAAAGDARLALGIHLLGTPWIEIDGRPATGPRGSKAWALLGYLVLSRSPASRERLAGLLFADADDPLGALRWNLAELRRALGSSASLTGDPVVIGLPPDALVDVQALGSASWLEAVQVPGLGLELLEGIDVQAGAAFDTWLLAERRHVARLSTAVLREAATGRLAMGAADQAVELATKLVALDEFDEEANALLVHAYLAAGAVDRAQQHLDAVVARVRRELGTEPSPALLGAIETWTQATRPALTFVQGAAAAASLIAAGEAAVGAGVFESGLEILRRAAVVAREAGDDAVEARALVVVGTALIHAGRGRGSEGATALHAALQLAARMHAPEVETEACRELGYFEMKEAHYERAASWLDRALATAPDPGARASVLAVRGVVASDQGRTATGIALLSEAATLAADADKPRLEAWALAFLARGQLLREELEAARASAVRSVELTRSAAWITFLTFPQSVLATVELALGRVDDAGAEFEAAFALGCQIADPCWEAVSARGIGLVHAARGRIEESVAWLDDARTRCMRIPDTYLWMHAYCMDALCEVAIEAGVPQARGWVVDLETVAARTGMQELLVRAQLHRTRLGDARAAEAARLFADRIDNPAVLARVAALGGAAALVTQDDRSASRE